MQFNALITKLLSHSKLLNKLKLKRLMKNFDRYCSLHTDYCTDDMPSYRGGAAPFPALGMDRNSLSITRGSHHWTTPYEHLSLFLYRLFTERSQMDSVLNPS